MPKEDWGAGIRWNLWVGILLLLTVTLGTQGVQGQPLAGLTVVNDSDLAVRVRVNCAKPLNTGVVLEPHDTLFQELPAITRPCLIRVSTLAPDPTSRSLRVDARGTTIIILPGRLPHTFVLEAFRDRP